MPFHVDFTAVRWPGDAFLVGTAIRFQPPDGMAMDVHFVVSRHPGEASETITASIYVQSCMGYKDPDKIIDDIQKDLRRRLED